MLTRFILSNTYINQGLASNVEDTMKTIPLMKKMVSPFLYSIIGGALIAHGHNLFLKTTPRQLLKGHRINIFDTASEIAEPFSVFGIKKEDLLPTEDLPNNSFGILNGKNDTPTGPFEMYTGLKDQSRYAYLISYKNEKKQTVWSTDSCNKIYGTDGAQFPPFRSKTDKLAIFTPDICRTLYLIYDREDEFKGIPVWRMKLDPKLFEPPKVNPDNECYCMHLNNKPDRCSIKGTIDLGGCLKGAPLILSAPHFLGTQPNLADLVEGLTPDRKKHEFFMYFEPRIASPVFAYGRIQLSIRVERTSFLRGFDQVRNAFIPFVWIEESGGVDDFLARILRIILVYIVDGSQAVAFLIMLIGLIMGLTTFAYGFLCSSRRLDSEERLYRRQRHSSDKLRHIDSEASSSSSSDDSINEDEERRTDTSNSSLSGKTKERMSNKNLSLVTPKTGQELLSSSVWNAERSHPEKNKTSSVPALREGYLMMQAERRSQEQKLSNPTSSSSYKRSIVSSSSRRVLVGSSSVSSSRTVGSQDMKDLEVGRRSAASGMTDTTIVTSRTTVNSSSTSSS